MLRNNEIVELFGEKLIITERSAYDVLQLRAFSLKHAKNRSYDIVLFEKAKVLQAGLKYNIETLKWFQVIKRLRLLYKFKIKYILKKLSTLSELGQYERKIYKLEGVDLEELDNPEKKNLKPSPITN